MFTTRVETWNVRKGSSATRRRVGKIVVRDAQGRFHGATNFSQLSRVGQVATHRRKVTA